MPYVDVNLEGGVRDITTIFLLSHVLQSTCGYAHR